MIRDTGMRGNGAYVWRRNLLAIMNLLPDHETIMRRLYEEYRRILRETKTSLIKVMKH